MTLLVGGDPEILDTFANYSRFVGVKSIHHFTTIHIVLPSGEGGANIGGAHGVQRVVGEGGWVVPMV